MRFRIDVYFLDVYVILIKIIFDDIVEKIIGIFLIFSRKFVL